MRIVFRRTGGFAGGILQATIETNDLPEGQRKEVEGLVRKADLAHLPPPPRRSGADRFQFDIEISDRGRRQAFAFVDGQLTEGAARLVNRLVEVGSKDE